MATFPLPKINVFRAVGATKIRKVITAHEANHKRIEGLMPEARAAALISDKAKFHKPKRRKGLGRLAGNIRREISRPVKEASRAGERIGKSVSRETGRVGKEVSRSASKVGAEAKRVPKNFQKITDSIIGGLKFGRLLIIGLGILLLVSVGKAFIR